MGACESKPPLKPNPYAPRDVVEHSKLRAPQTPIAKVGCMYLEDSFLKRQVAIITKPNCRDTRIEEVQVELDKSFGLSKKFESLYEVGEEVGRGRFRRTCTAVVKKGRLKGQKVAVKIIPKSKMTTTTAIESIRREVKILRALKGHPNVVQFHGAFQDAENVYIVTELCEGGQLLDKMLSRGGKFSDDEVKAIVVQILNVIACLHLQGVVHGDIKPENFLFTSKDENSQLKAIGFGSSDFVKPDQKLVASSEHYVVAPEVLRRSYNTEVDLWSTGVITYILLCGNRPFRAQAESETYHQVLKANNEDPWPLLSAESKDFVKRLLDENPSRRISAAQALCHPWIRNEKLITLTIDICILRLMKAYMRSSSLRKAALRALSKTLSADEIFYLKEQFTLMCPDESGGITSETIKKGLTENRADAIKESHIMDLLDPLKTLQFRKMYFDEFCSSAINIHQIEAFDNWEQRSNRAYEIFEKDGNRPIVIEELASELGLEPTVSVRVVVQEWIRHNDGKLSVHGFWKLLLHGNGCEEV